MFETIRIYLIRRSYLLQPEVFWQVEKFSHVDGLAKSI